MNPRKNGGLFRNPKLKMTFKRQIGSGLTQSEFYTVIGSSELLAKLLNLGVDKDRDKSLIFVGAVIAWIITGNLTGRLFGVELTGFVAGCFIVFFGNNIVGAFRLGVEQAILETISDLGIDEIRTRTKNLTEIEDAVASHQHSTEPPSGSRCKI